MQAVKEKNVREINSFDAERVRKHIDNAQNQSGDHPLPAISSIVARLLSLLEPMSSPSRIVGSERLVDALFDDRDSLQFKVFCLRMLPYDEYLKTNHWRDISELARKRFDGRCALCNSSKSTQVHHRTYENLGSEELSDLTLLCDECHEMFHKNSKLRRD